MQQLITQHMKMVGQFQEDSFRNWVMHRAKILDLDVKIKTANSSLVELSASGHPILVEALEIACSLGPLESTVESIQIN